MKFKFKMSVFCILALMLAGVACAGSVISVPAEGPDEDGALLVTVSGVSGVSGVSFLLEYNADNLAVESASIGGGFAGASLTKNIDNSAGKTKFVIITTSAINAEEASELVNVKFSVIDPADTAVIITDPEWSDSVDFLPHDFDSVIDGSPEPAATATAAPTSSSSSSSGGYISYTAAATTAATDAPTAVKTSAPESTVAVSEEPTVAAPDVTSDEPAEEAVTPDVTETDNAGTEAESTGPASTPGFGVIAALLSVVFVAVVISKRK
ncbi:hypothetical protein [Methanoplanus endosymbiosus]|uniref:Cohesin domain-containing protein n=1 Tax=Methanoplanus endosymbiosus TaxID=33865 RepID=A0A9E7PLE3_9EURY|nr:hypothetical protein [Methanoplanus endosymbiosus]UUX92318.1 hypothetical protein L6E24_13415 [Methanoplanus endosymbiosus]